MKREGRLDSYVAKWFEAVKSYLRFRRVNVDVFPRLSAAKGESLGNEIVPTQEQLGKVLERLSLRGRVVALLMAHAGVRPGVIGAYQGEAGLRLRDLPDLKLGKELTIEPVPFVVRVPAAISKTRRAYTTFGTKQLATALLAYLESRREKGEGLAPDSPVVVAGIARGAAARSLEGAKFRRGFLTTKGVVEEVHDALKSTVPEGGRWRPYVLRAYCSSRLLMAEGAGKITRDLREAILGHDLGISGRYNLGKTWGEDMLRDARAAYKRAEPYLSTTGAPVATAEEIQREAAVLLLTGFKGKSESDARRLVEGKTGPELADLLRSGAKPCEQAVPVEDVPKLLGDGWEFVSALNGTLAVLRAPVGPPADSTTPPFAQGD